MSPDQKISELESCGLSTNQATVYLALLTRGTLPASKLVAYTPFSRPMIYRILDELAVLELIEKLETPGSVAKFQCSHPIKLRRLADKWRAETEQKSIALERVLGTLVSDYSTFSDRPGVRILQGLSGVTELYEDILNERQNILLLRSPNDNSFPELHSLVIKQIIDQTKLRICTRAITPFTNETKEEITETDTNNMVERRLVWLEQFDIPAQIIIYADKVAITAFDSDLMTTIIQNTSISSSFRAVFEFLWQAAYTSDQEIRTGLLQGTITPPRPTPLVPLRDENM